MTTVEIEFRYEGQLSEATVLALSHMRELCGLRALRLEEERSLLRVDYDVTHLTEAAIEGLLRRAGVAIAAPLKAAEQESQILG